jgi:hypothetical protein
VWWPNFPVANNVRSNSSSSDGSCRRLQNQRSTIQHGILKKGRHKLTYLLFRSEYRKIDVNRDRWRLRNLRFRDQFCILGFSFSWGIESNSFACKFTDCPQAKPLLQRLTYFFVLYQTYKVSKRAFVITHKKFSGSWWRWKKVAVWDKRFPR